MKRILKAFVMSFSMFTAIPCPIQIWDEEARPLMTVCLPAVGAVLGALWFLLAWGLKAAGIPWIFSAAVLTACPLFITGFMHMDGLMDVTDAVKSWRDRDERLRILKDSHTGAFAVIVCVLYLILLFAAFAGFTDNVRLICLIFIPVISRAMSALAVTVLKPLQVSEYAGAYRDNIKKSHVIVCLVFLMAAIALTIVLGRWQGLSGVAVILGYLLFLRKTYKSLGGMSGDISGYALTWSELFGVAALMLLGMI